ncbi:MAG: L,D-transpeptidase family protein [Rhodospirillales bacterium]|nr:L,D-transpeptidase family protein [Rhodospirillales bacterium]
MLGVLASFCLVHDAALARGGRDAAREEFNQSRAVGVPVMAVVSLARQRVTVYDADGWIMTAPVSSGRGGYETPAGIYSILQRKVEHFSNLYDDAEMPFMQRLTWSGIALHAGALPGYPASHGCVRMPHGFAERLFEVTRLGMRVIVMRDDISPADFSHPALFRPAPGDADGTIQPSVVALGSGSQAAVSFPNLRRIAAAKAAEAEAATTRLEEARRAAAAKYKEAAGANRMLRAAQTAKLRAEFHVREIERRLGLATDPAARAELEDAKTKGLAKVDETKAAFEAVEAEVQPALDALAQVREATQAALQAKTAAEEEAREARRRIAPISVFISRATQRLYVRQALQPLFESPVTIAEADWRFDRWVRQHFPDIGHGALQKLMRTGQFRLDGRRVQGSERVQAGQVIRVPPMPQRSETRAKPEIARVRPGDEKLIRQMVIHEDDAVLVLNKPPGLAVQAEIKTGERRIIQYLLSPIAQTLDEAGRER